MSKDKDIEEMIEIPKAKLTKIVCELGEASMRVDECVAQLTSEKCWICERLGLEGKADDLAQLNLCHKHREKIWPKFLGLLEALIDMGRQREDKKVPLVETVTGDEEDE